MSLLALATATTTADDEDHDSPNENYDDDKDDSQTEDYAEPTTSCRHVVCKLCRGNLVKMDTWDGDCDHTAYSYAIRMYQRTLTLRGTTK